MEVGGVLWKREEEMEKHGEVVRGVKEGGSDREEGRGYRRGGVMGGGKRRGDGRKGDGRREEDGEEGRGMDEDGEEGRG